jgi:hypothetical protein
MVALLGDRLRPATLRAGSFFAGFWVVLLLSSQIAVFAYLGRGPLARLLGPVAGQPPLNLTRRIVWTFALTVLLLSPARVCAGGLLAEARRGWRSHRRAWPALFAIVLPTAAILAGAFKPTTGFRFFGPRVFLYAIVPVVVCLLLALLGMTWKPSQTTLSGLGARGAFLSAMAAGALFAGLGKSPELRLWAMERHLSQTRSAHYAVLYDPRAYSVETVRSFADERERILAGQAARLNVPADHVHLRVVLYPDFAGKKAATGTMRAFSVMDTTIHAVLGGYVTQLDPAADAAALLHAAWGAPGTPSMDEWVARWLAGTWYGQAIPAAAAQIESEVGHYSLADLLGSDTEGFLSPLVRNPLGAAWVSTVFDADGIATVRNLYGTRFSNLRVASLARALATTPDQLERNWRQWAQTNASQMADAPSSFRGLGRGFFFRGVSFSHEGWTGVGAGYASAEAEAQLQKLAGMGVNAIAVVPYGFSRGPSENVLFYTSTDETDEDLTEALYVAHRLGMKVMLKPQLWLSFGDFTGQIRFEDPAARAAWMRRYREFILHYARLAELQHFDLLCIGTELEGMTPFADEWRPLIAEIRRVYHGPLTYAANWGKEFESLGFWDALDYIGLNNYYPLSAKPFSRAEELLPGAERLAARLEVISRRWRRPLLFTEIGYPSVQGGSSEPWVEDAHRNINLAEQAAAYEAIFRGLSARPWFRGMFWWKWPSSGRGGGAQDPSYTPMGKPAAEVLHTWYTRLGANSSSTEHAP